jgi:hypothetical protein
MTKDPPQASARPGPRLGSVVLVVTVLVAAVGLAVAVVQLGNALDGRVRDRTPLGVALMVIGFLGPVVALIAIRRWKTLSQAGLRQWPSLGLFPGTFLVLWMTAALAYWVLGTVGRPILPHTPTLTIQIDAEGRPQFHAQGEFTGYEQGGGESRADGKLVGDRSFTFRTHPDESGVQAITFAGTVTWAEGKTIELRGELVLTQTVRVRLDGLAQAVLMIDDQPRESPVVLEAGTYRIVVRGRPGE